MRFAAVIIALGAIALALVHLRRVEISARHERQRLLVSEVELRRVLFDQQVRLSNLTSPAELRRRVAELESTGGAEGRGVAESPTAPRAPEGGVRDGANGGAVEPRDRAGVARSEEARPTRPYLAATRQSQDE